MQQITDNLSADRWNRLDCVPIGEEEFQDIKSERNSLPVLCKAISDKMIQNPIRILLKTISKQPTLHWYKIKYPAEKTPEKSLWAAYEANFIWIKIN